MTQAPDVNQVATLVEKIINEIVAGVAPDIFEAAMEVQFPFLDVEPVKVIFDELCSYAFGDASKLLQELASKGVINLQVNAEDGNVQTSVQALQKAVETGDPVQIASARQNVDQAFKNLVSWDGTANPVN